MQIHYDCDPGQDDAIALLLAFGAGVDVRSLSTVGGNVDVAQCTRNALQLLEFTNRTHIPVFEGASLPLRRAAQPLPEVFGECGMAGANLPTPQATAQTQHAANFLANSAMDKTLPRIIVATGPLTNLAMAVQQNPDFSTHIDHLIIMGGCVYPEHIHGRLGNIQIQGTNAWAEYNFAVDPEAAQIVFSSGIKNISLIPLEITRSVLYRRAVDNALRAEGTPAAILAANILSTVGTEDRDDYKSEMQDAQDPVRAMHDVVAMAYLTNPELFETASVPLRINTQDAAGQSQIDAATPDHPQVNLITDVNKPAFMSALISHLTALT